MARVFRFRNYGVYVFDERGSPHHLPHAHIMRRGQRVASLFLLSLELFNVVDQVSADLVAELSNQQQQLLAAWEELNGD
jgi:hypothetical protein